MFDRSHRVRCFALVAAMAAWLGAAVPAAAAPAPEELIRQAFGDDAPLMLRIAQCESHLNPIARNPRSSARGLFQLTSLWGSEAERLDPAANVRIAKWLFDRSGTRPWKASEGCWGGAVPTVAPEPARPPAVPLPLPLPLLPPAPPLREMGILRLVG